jgi:hypothetical protein
MKRLLKFIPRLGLIGPARLREAEASQDMVALKTLLEGALKRLFQLDGQEDCWPWVQALFPDSLVVERDGKLLKYPFTVEGTDVAFGEPEHVVTSYAPVDGQPGDQPDGIPATPGKGATFTEAEKQGRGARAFEVCIEHQKYKRSLNEAIQLEAFVREGVISEDSAEKLKKLL